MDVHGSGFRADVQGLRALAVVLVVVYHTGLAAPGGFTGVDVFFVLSGFVIMGSIMRGFDAGTGFSPREFFGRRVRRLLPALAVMTVVCIPLMSLFTTFDGREQGHATARSASTFWANIQLMLFRPNGYFVATEQTNPFLHTWSLSLEEQIYLVFPFIAVGLIMLVRRLGQRIRRIALLVGFVILGLASFRLAIIGTYAIDAWPVNAFILLPDNVDYGKQLAFYSPLTRLWEFLAGAVLAVIPVITHRLTAGLVAVGGFVLLLYSGFGFSSGTPFPGWAALVPVFGTVMLLVSQGGWFRGVLASRLLGWLGDRSYSWYLWHWPAITFGLAVFPGSRVTVLSAAVVSLGLADLSYRLVEQPIREGRFWRARWWRTPALGVACVTVPLALATYGRIEPTPELATHEDVEFGCVVAEFSVLLDPESCHWPVSSAVGDAVLIGDSQAGHLSGAFIRAAHERKLNARIVTRTGAFFQNTPDRDELARMLIDEVRPKVVVFGQLTVSWDPDFWAPQMRSYVERLTNAGIGVVVPHRVHKGGEPLKCPPIRVMVLANTCELNAEESRQSAEDLRAIMALEAATLEGVEGVVLFDPNDALCPGEPCSSYQGGRWIWRDGGHLSREGAQRLTPLLSAAMSAVFGNS